jgi:stringent starvation protein B
MISQKPYLVRALIEWCNDNSFTPHLMTFVDNHTAVPRQYVHEDKIVLNVALNATKELLIDNHWITFQATFNGVVEDVAIPVANVLAIFAKENGLGMQFELENYTPPAATPGNQGEKGGLKLVK